MKLSKRQEQIIAVVKEHQPVSGERISDILAVSRATLRSDLSFLTLSGILKSTIDGCPRHLNSRCDYQLIYV